RICRACATCAAFSKSGMVSSMSFASSCHRAVEERAATSIGRSSFSLEVKIQSRKRRKRGARNDMSRVRLIEVVAIREVIEIDLQVDVFGDWVGHHRIEHPVAGDLLHLPRRWIQRNGRACGAAVDELRAAADREAPWGAIGGPKIESVLRHVG